MLIRVLSTATMAAVLACPGIVLAADPLVLSIHDSQFEPKQLAIPSGAKLKLLVRNLDALPAEFESTDLSREIVVPGHGEATIYIGPLDPGIYQFFNDFNHDMQGTIVAAPAASKEN